MGGSELESFLTMVRPFDQKNRVKVELDQILDNLDRVVTNASKR